MNGIVVLQSDFGIDSGLVASMYGVCKSVDRNLEIFDLTHLIPAFNIKAASEYLHYTVLCWPKGTVFVSVVDPGVGTDRKACVARTENGYYIVTPDNGTLTCIKKYYGIDEVREINSNIHYYKNVEYIDVFHGRDLFSYCAAKLASGKIRFEEVGEQYSVDNIVEYEIPDYSITENEAIGAAFSANGNNDEGFGILMTNIPSREFCESGFQFGEKVYIELSLEKSVIMEGEVTFHKSFGYVEISEPVLHPEINTFLGLALNMDNFCRKYAIKSNMEYKIVISKLLNLRE